MNTDAERDFGLDRGVKRERIRMDPRPRNDEGPIQKTLSPKGYGENESAASLLVSRGPLKGTLLSRASSATHFGRNVGIHSFSTACRFAGWMPRRCNSRKVQWYSAASWSTTPVFKAEGRTSHV
jgi:hypothetical protein